METLLEKLPSKFGKKDQSHLTEFCKTLDKVLGTSLESIVLYGNATFSDYHPDSGGKQMLIVVRKVDTEMMKSVMKPVYKMKKVGFESTFITEENLVSSTDVFPIKYQSMRESYVILHGEDVLQRLDISRAHIRLICEQELRNLSLSLEKHYLDNKGRYLKEMMSGVVAEFIETLRVAVLLKTREMPSWEDAIDRTIMTFQVEALILREMMQLRNGQIKLNKKQIEGLYDKFMSLVDQMVGIVDKMD